MVMVGRECEPSKRPLCGVAVIGSCLYDMICGISHGKARARDTSVGPH